MRKLIGSSAALALMAATTVSVYAVEAPDLIPADPHNAAETRLTGPGEKITGTITEIDNNQGTLTLAADVGTLQLHFPPMSVHDLRKGDKMTAEFSLAKADTQPGSTRAYDAPKASGEHRMAGTITSIDQPKGWIQVKTEETTLKLHFTPQKLEGLQKGDRVMIDLAFARQS